MCYCQEWLLRSLISADVDMEEPREQMTDEKKLESKEKKEPLLICSSVLTMSGAPRTHWTTLARLDEIRQRNKADDSVVRHGTLDVELMRNLQVRKPKHAPFFLPTTATLSGFVFDDSGMRQREAQERELSKVIERSIDTLIPASTFVRQLRAAYAEGGKVVLWRFSLD